MDEELRLYEFAARFVAYGFDREEAMRVVQGLAGEATTGTCSSNWASGGRGNGSDSRPKLRSPTLSPRLHGCRTESATVVYGSPGALPGRLSHQADLCTHDGRDHHSLTHQEARSRHRSSPALAHRQSQRQAELRKLNPLRAATHRKAPPSHSRTPHALSPGGEMPSTEGRNHVQPPA